jgi:surface antigen
LLREKQAISKPISQSLKLESTFSLQAKRTKKFIRIFHYRLGKRKLVRYGLIVGNVVLLVAVILFIVSTPKSTVGVQTGSPLNDANVINPLDQLSSASIALTVARLDNLPETTAVKNQADSEETQLTMAPNNNSVITKPQVVATNYVSNKDIKTYVVQSGDTISSIAQKFNISTNSILWSNNISGNYVTPGVKLLIPPVNGIVYTVKTGDTPASLATKYQSNQNLIIAYNDAEIKGIYPGERIIIPNGTEPSVLNYLSQSATYGWGFQGGCYYNGHAYPNYGYACGNCTWWVAYQRALAGNPLPTDLGNANTWGTIAQQFGIPVGTTPSVGAVVVWSMVNGCNQYNSYYCSYGHVAYVTAVHTNGTITISEMNRVGWNTPDYRIVSSIGHEYVY